MWLLAIRRGTEWVFDPQAETVLNEGDVLLFQGPEDGVNLIREIAGAPALPDLPESEGPPLTELDRAVDILVEMKNSAEVAVGLAYSALLFNDRALAAEVGTLEARSDVLHDELTRIWSETKLSVLFVTHNVREAVRLAERVVLLSSRPGRVAREWTVDIPQPRRIEDAPVAELAREITEELRGEIRRHGQH